MSALRIDTPRFRNRPLAPPSGEPPLVSGPRKIMATARHIAAVLEREPGLWPGLTTCVTDTDGRIIVHYTIVTGRDSAGGEDAAAALSGPDGVVARWRSLLARERESRRERGNGRERITTVRGFSSGFPVTVLFTVLHTGRGVYPRTGPDHERRTP
ncbi:hypothetical protein PWG71_24735 [Nocardiopsis sp. N85]|uniref:hypothetical protein n=1 Tax=Nocardiopsis sp. N85 TaxID=3029400 RepID=UPI00237F305E|nr:hypothetical protein [Nocardiopsis sp. N85]MDE3724607.1 hypothetical protein [Nocardiopsis sp. N85]